MDEQTKQNLRENQYRPKTVEYYTEGHWLIGDQKEAFLSLKSKVSTNCKILRKHEKRINGVLKEIGSYGVEIQEIIKKRNSGMTKENVVSVKTVFKKCFGSSANRVYEAIAYCRAVKVGLPERLPATSLIKFGEALGNEKINSQLLDKIKSGTVSIDGKKVKICELTHREVIQTLSDLRHVQKDGGLDIFFKEAIQLISRAKSHLSKLNGLIKDGSLSSSKGQIRIKLGNLQDEIKSLQSDVTVIEKKVADTARPSSVSKKVEISDDDWDNEE